MQSSSCSCQMPCFDWAPPVFTFWLCPWPKPGLIRSVIGEPCRGPTAGFAVLVDHVGRAAVDVNVVLDDEIERLAVEDVGRVNDLRRMSVLARLEAGRHRPMHFAGADAVDQPAVPPHQVEDRQVRAAFWAKRTTSNAPGRRSARRFSPRRTHRPACRTCGPAPGSVARRFQ